MKDLLMDRVGLVLENYYEELEVLLCDHEWGKVKFTHYPTSYYDDITEHECDGCEKCEHAEDEIEAVQLITIGHII